MELKTLIAECTAYDFKVMLEEKKPKSWLKSVSTFAFFCLLITIFNMDVSTVISIQNQLVTHINKTIKASTDDEIVVDKTILTCCPADEDICLIMDTEFRKLLINDGLFYTGASNSGQLCIEKIKSYPIDYTDIRKAMKMSVRAQDISSSVIDMYLMLYYDETNNIKKFKLNEEKHKFNVPAERYLSWEA